SVAEGIPEKEPRVDDEEADGKGKEKVIDEQVARDLLTLQTPKKKSLVDQFIFQRRTSTPTGSSGHDESLSLYAELGLTESEVESDKDVLGIDARVLDEGQAGPNPGDQDEGHAGPNPDKQDEGQARLNPSDAVASQPLPSPVVHSGPNLEHMDLEGVILKMKATYYPDVGLEQMVPDQMWIDEECKYDIVAIQGITELKPQDLEGLAFKLVKVFHPNVIHLQYQIEACHKLLTDSVDNSIIRHNVSKLLPLGGPPSHVTIQSEFFFNKDMEYLRYGSKVADLRCQSRR
nr:hypothetical protein [Tanacetum cinerariifolium]